PNVVAPAEVASPATTQRDSEVATQPARMGAAERSPERALDSAQEVALIPVWETALGPARDTALVSGRETAVTPARDTALVSARETALTPARETASNEGGLQASTCIRNNIKAAYRSSETVDQATSFLMRKCFAPFSSGIASDEASARTLFRGLVFQEISPVEWLQALEESPAQGR